MQIKLVKFGSPVQWARSTETYLETSKHHCRMEYRDMVLYVTDDSGDVVLVPVGNIAYMQVAKPRASKKGQGSDGQSAQ